MSPADLRAFATFDAHGGKVSKRVEVLDHADLQRQTLAERRIVLRKYVPDRVELAIALDAGLFGLAQIGHRLLRARRALAL